MSSRVLISFSFIFSGFFNFYQKNISKDNKFVKVYKDYETRYKSICNNTDVKVDAIKPTEYDDINDKIKDYLKYYIKSEFITDSVSENYLLWKSADKDNIYDYNRKYIESYYNPDIYLPDYGLELEIENYEYDGINDDDEPRYTSFNHFIDNKTYDDFYTVA